MFNPFNLQLIRHSENVIRHKCVQLKQKTTFGRSTQNDFVLSTTQCSKIHCSMEFRDGKVFVQHHSTVRGTFVNGKKLTANEDVEMKEDDIISFGVDPSKCNLSDRKNYVFRLKRADTIDLIDSDEEVDSDEGSLVIAEEPHAAESQQGQVVPDINQNIETLERESDEPTILEKTGESNTESETGVSMKAEEADTQFSEDPKENELQKSSESSWTISAEVPSQSDSDVEKPKLPKLIIKHKKPLTNIEAAERTKELRHWNLKTAQLIEPQPQFKRGRGRGRGGKQPMHVPLQERIKQAFFPKKRGRPPKNKTNSTESSMSFQ